MATAVVMSLVGAINIPQNMSEGVDAETKVQASGSVEVLEDTNQFTPVVVVRVLDSGGEEHDGSLDIFAHTSAEEKELCRGVVKVSGLLFGEFDGIIACAE